jgi:hypothetical protein
MAEFIGSPLTDGVAEQLAKRQELQGKTTNRTNDELMYLTSKAGWVKLSSAVNTLTDEEVNLLRKRKGRGTIKGDSTLAATNVLVGGLLDPNGSLRYGIDVGPGFSVADQDVGSLFSAYSNRKETAGIRPMPGITGMTVQSKNTYGTLRQAEVKFVCWTLEDFEFMEKLYLRPGFSILLEWGHSMFLDNSGQVQTLAESVSQDFFRSGITMQEILNEIRTLRQKNSYNYEAMIGYVKNFSWNYTKSGGYECSVSIISTGEILESLAMRFHPGQRLPQDEIDNEGSTTGKLQKKSMYHYFHQKLQNTTDEFFEKADLEEDMPTFIKALEDFRGYYHKVQHDDTGVFDEDTPTHWVPIRVIFDIFNKHISWVDVSKSLGSEDYVYLKFNTDYSKSSKYVTSEEHFSIDPNICALPWEAKIKIPSIDWMATLLPALIPGAGPAISYYLYNYNQPEDTEEYTIRVDAIHDNVLLPADSDKEDILNIMVSVPYVISKVDESIDADGKRTKSVHDIFMSILEGMETALGGINDFDFVYEDDTNTYYLVDRNVTPANADNHPTLTLSGLDSIFTDVSISSKISNEMGSQVSIAAQGSTFNYTDNVENLIKWNPKIIDRIRVTKDTSTKQPPESEQDVEQQQEKRDRIEDWFDDVETFYDDFNSDWEGYDQEDLEAAKTMHAEWTVENVVQKYKAKKGEPIPGLIPIELSITLDGIGGFIIGQAFKIAPGILPSHYEGKFGFIVTGIEHSLDTKNRWETTVKALFYILEKEQALGGISSGTPPADPNADNANRPPIAKKVGGAFRTIEGTTYRNGEIPENKLRYINNWKAYKGAVASDGGRIRLYTTASRDLDRLLAAATAAGVILRINSAYRTLQDQQRVYNQNCSPNGVCSPPTATPGKSNHGFGLAVDFANKSSQKMKESFPEYKWLAANGEKYGFRRIASEAWHWEYQNS